MSRDRLTMRYWHVAQLLLLLACLANSGCLVATAGVAGGAVAGYAFYKGKVSETYNANCEDTWAATRTALGELGMPIVREERKGCDGFLESRTADGDRVRIYVEGETSRFPAEGKISRVSVRVAVFGDGPVSNRVLDQVGVHLAPRPPAGRSSAAAWCGSGSDRSLAACKPPATNRPAAVIAARAKIVPAGERGSWAAPEPRGVAPTPLADAFGITRIAHHGHRSARPGYRRCELEGRPLQRRCLAATLCLVEGPRWLAGRPWCN